MNLFRPFLFEEAGDAGSGGAPAGGGGGNTTLFGGDGGSPPAGGDAGGGTSAPNPATTWVGDDGAFSEGWLDRLDGDLKGHSALKVIGNVKDLAKSYVETKKLVGTKLEMPGEGATPEQVAAWRKIVGAPEKPEGYLGDAKTLRPDTIPETMWDAKAEQGFLAVAHKHNLPPSAVKDIMAYYGEHLSGSVKGIAEQETAHLAGEMTKLKGAWGNDFDVNLALAERVAKTSGLSLDHPMFTDSGVMQAFAKLGKMFNETSLVAGERHSSAAGGFDARIQEIQDPKSQAIAAREYRGEFGPERQAQAAETLRSLIKAKSETKP